jgi:hypothetical protein
MSDQEITAYRLANQLIASNHKTPLEVAQHMGAMQAQDYYGTLWALGLRTGKTEKEIIKTLENAEIVRTWPQRGTLHVVPAEDAKWLVSLSAERLLRGARLRRERLGLDDKTLAKSKEILSSALSKTKLLTRPQIMETLENANISTKSGRGYHILWYFSQTGVTVVGPMEGKQQTFALLDSWVAKSKNLSREEGVAELAKRYFASHGPATIQDFMWWTGLTSKDARLGLEANRSALVSEKVEKKEYWLPQTMPKLNNVPTGYLLPGFDEYMLGYKDRSAALHVDYANKIVPGGNGMFLSTIVINGQIVGTWKRDIKKDQVLIKLSLFKNLTKSELELLKKPAEDYAKFLGLPVSLESD